MTPIRAIHAPAAPQVLAEPGTSPVVIAATTEVGPLLEAHAPAGLEDFVGAEGPGVDASSAKFKTWFGESRVAAPVFGRAQTLTPEFRAWFGDSKVVDEQGHPLVVFHGAKAHFTRFDLDRGYPYFSALQKEASLYATDGDKLRCAIAMARKYRFEPASAFEIKSVYTMDEDPGYLTDYVGPDGQVFPVEDALALTRPGGFTILTGKRLEPDYERGLLLVVDGTSKLEGYYRETVKEAEDAAAVENPCVLMVYLAMQNPYVTDDHTYAAQFVNMEIEPGAWRLVDHHREVERLKSLGFDGVIAPSDGARLANSVGVGPGHDVLNYLIFDPAQVKSAIGNSGAFDIHNPDMCS